MSTIARNAVIGTVVAMGAVTLGSILYIRHSPKAAVQAPLKEKAQPEKKGPELEANLGRGYPGLVVSGEAVDIAPEMDGKLEAVHVRLGQRVKQGELLATIDVGQAQRQLAMAEAQRNGAAAELDRVQLELEQATEQLKSEEKIAGHLSRSDLAKARYLVKIAASKVSSARANLLEKKSNVEQLRQSVEQASLKAPFHGVVSERYAAVGAVVNRSTPILRLVGSDELKVRFAVPEAEAARVALGGQVQVGFGETIPTVPALIESFSPEIDPASRSLFAEARLQAPREVLSQIPSGRAARVFLSTPPPNNRN